MPGNRSAPGQGMLSFCQTPAQARPGGVHKFYNKVIGTSHLGLFCCFNTHLALAVCIAELIRDKSSSWHGSLGNAHQFLSQDLSVLVG